MDALMRQLANPEETAGTTRLPASDDTSFLAGIELFDDRGSARIGDLLCPPQRRDFLP
jgi:hypothetical protein